MPQFAIFMVFVWPLVVVWLFARLDAPRAVSWSILGGYLLLPQSVRFDLPLLPAIDKDTVPAVAALIAAAAFTRSRAPADGAPQPANLPGLLPRRPVVILLLAMLVLGGIGTVLTNGDALRFPGKSLPALRPYDAASLTMTTLVGLVPFLLARKYIATPEAQTRLLVVLALAGLAYSLPALWEVRLSPQLSRQIYGYFPHSWRQHIRAGGYRPVVFLHHGLWLAIFFCASFLAILSLWRGAAAKHRGRWMIAGLWMLMVLVLAKGVGALAIGLLLGAMIVLLPFRLQILGAAVLAGVILLYPMVRGAGLVPTARIAEIATSYSAERGGSLGFRLKNEDILLDRARQRPLFGWGSWGRNRVFDEEGQDISVTDGYWILSIGIRGWVGYLAEFGLLIIPLILLALRWRSLGLTAATGGLALALTANLIDLIPNGTMTPVTWLLAGALAGRLEYGRAAAAVPTAAAAAVQASPYTRQPRHHPARGNGAADGLPFPLADLPTAPPDGPTGQPVPATLRRTATPAMTTPRTTARDMPSRFPRKSGRNTARNPAPDPAPDSARDPA